MTVSLLPAGKDLRGTLPGRHHLIHVAPHNGAHRVALRAGISMAVPLLVLWLTGHVGWAPYAAFGAFTSLFGRGVGHAERLRMQLQAGTAQVLAVAIGAAIACSADRRWLAVVAVAGCAALGSLASDRLGWHPGGPLFIVFGSAAVGLAASVPSRIPVALAVSAAAALCAVAIGSAGRLRPATSRVLRSAILTPACRGRAATRARPARAAQDASQQAASGQAGEWRQGRAQAFRYGLAVLIAGGAATAAGIGHPYWAMVSAVVAVTGADTPARLARAVHRLAGTLAGVLIAAALLAPHLPALAVIAVIAVLQGATELAVGRHYAIAVMLLTPLALAMGTLAQPVSITTLLHDRTIETILGVAIGVIISLAAHQRQPMSLGKTQTPPEGSAAGACLR